MRTSSWVAGAAMALTVTAATAFGSRGPDGVGRISPAPVALASSVDLEAKEREIERLREQLAAVESTVELAEADRLGVSAAVKASGLTDRQQRRVAAAI